jgi:hypothetical protein
MKPEIEMSAILQQIKNRIDEKRLSGSYPPGLEQQLEREFAEIMSSTNRRYFASKELQLQLSDLELVFAKLSGRVSTQSRIPGASLIHLVFSKISKRQILGVTAQVREVEAQVLVVLKMLGEFAQSQEEADSRVVRELSQHVLDRVSVVDHLAILTTDLESRIRIIESRLGE